MRKESIKQLIVITIVILTIEAGVVNASIAILKNTSLYGVSGDIIDQSQTEWYGAGLGTQNSAEMAQSFKPTLPILTRVELIVWHEAHENPTGTVLVSIRNSLTGADLTSFLIDAENIPMISSSITWVEFDFPDIPVIPEQTYYIYMIINLDTPAAYWAWGHPTLNPYTRGEAYWYQSPYPEEDFCFRTYGTSSNAPPEKPDINGPTTVTVGTETTYTFIAIDPEGDNIYYEIDWGDGHTENWFGPFVSNVVIQKSHTWESKGAAIIKARAKDIHGAIGSWEYMSITVPYSYNLPFMNLWERLFEQFPYAFPILRHLFGY